MRTAQSIFHAGPNKCAGRQGNRQGARYGVPVLRTPAIGCFHVEGLNMQNILYLHALLAAQRPAK